MRADFKLGELLVWSVTQMYEMQMELLLLVCQFGVLGQLHLRPLRIYLMVN